mgnify:CR=1 FL=1
MKKKSTQMITDIITDAVLEKSPTIICTIKRMRYIHESMYPKKSRPHRPCMKRAKRPPVLNIVTSDKHKALFNNMLTCGLYTINMYAILRQSKKTSPVKVFLPGDVFRIIRLFCFLPAVFSFSEEERLQSRRRRSEQRRHR